MRAYTPARHNPWESSCEPLRPVGGRITAAERHQLPDEAFGYVHWERARRGGRRRPGYPGSWHKRRDYPMDDVVHARNAKARASKAYNMGRISRTVRDAVYRKADAIIRRCRGVIPFPARRRRVAANPGPGWAMAPWLTTEEEQARSWHRAGRAREIVTNYLARMSPNEEIDAWGLARETGLQPLTADLELKHLYDIGMADRDGKWYSPAAIPPRRGALANPMEGPMSPDEWKYYFHRDLRRPPPPGINEVIEAAEAHGEASDPDHEVGDLQVALREAWEIMDPAQQKELMESGLILEILEWLEG